MVTTELTGTASVRGADKPGARRGLRLVLGQLARLASARALAVCVLLWATQVQAQVMAEPALGEVRKIDLSAAKITLKHGEIKSLDMPPMTMVFTVQDASTLAQFRVGDQVRFVAVIQNGKMVVTEMQRVP